MSTYSTDLRIQLIADGDQAGTWGQTTNTNLGTIIEQAIAGVSGGPSTGGTYPAVNFPTDADITLTANNGTVDQARNAVLAVTSTGSLTAQRNIIAPTGASKVYIIKNNTTGGQNVQIKYSTGTGVIVGNGLTALVYGDGTNFNLVSSASGGGSNNTQVQQFTATQGQTVFTLTYTYTPNTNSMLVFVNGSKQIAGVNYTETSNTVITFASGLNAGDLVEAVYGIASSTAVITSANVAYNQGGTGAVTTNVQSKLRETVSVKDFGAVGDGVADDTAAIQAALNVGGVIFVPKGTYNFTQVTMSVANTELNIGSGATIKPTIALQKAIIVTADNCAITGNGVILSPATFNGDAAINTYGTVWVENCRGFYAAEITFENTPKASLWFSNSTQWKVEGISIHGNYPYASYNENTTTGNWGIAYDPPPTSNGWQPSAIVDANNIRGVIQGFGYGNLGAAGRTSGISITGNTFAECWDHAIYGQLSEGTVIAGNNMFNCRRPIVVDGLSCSVVGNTLYADATNQLNHEQQISVRDCKYATITGNTLYGVGAGIDVGCLTMTDTIGNVVANNTLIGVLESTYLKASIRLGVSSTNCYDNIIEGNRIYSTLASGVSGVIELLCPSGTAVNNTVKNNTINMQNVAPAMLIQKQNSSIISGNVLTFNGSSASSITSACIQLDTCTNLMLKSNSFRYVTGGSNVTLRAIDILASNSNTLIDSNVFNITASLVSYTPYNDATSTTQYTNNQLVIGTSMQGTFTWPSGANGYVVSNGNVNSNSTIVVTPANAAAGALMASVGIYITKTAGSFTIWTADASVTGSSTNWLVRIS